jgi:hypothetical protein
MREEMPGRVRVYEDSGDVNPSTFSLKLRNEALVFAISSYTLFSFSLSTFMSVLNAHHTPHSSKKFSYYLLD